ncbi:MAG: mechanosensitive ion channel family protein [Gemmatimonadota bacterium]
MQTVVYGNTLITWASAAGGAAALLVTLLFARKVIAGRLAVLAGRTHNHIDDLVLGLVRGTRAWFLSGAALTAAARWLELPAAAGRLIEIAVVIGVVIQGALWGNVLIRHVVQRQVQQRIAIDDAASATTIGALGFLARLLLWSVLLLLGLDNLGVNITALVAGLGVGGIAVALALQNILGDLFASLSIVLDKPFVNGDFIIVDDLMGTVEHVGLKTTRVRSLHGEQIIFSNTDLLKSRIRNYKRMQERRVVFALGVTYDTPPQKVAAIPHMLRAIIATVPGVRYDRAHFKSYGAFSLDFEIVYYVLDADYNRYMDVQQALNLAILSRFNEEGIEFAFPTQTLHLSMPRREQVAVLGS